MLAKTTEQNGRDWDRRLPYVLYAYRAARQESTQESPFFLVYGRDPQLPTPDSLTQPRTCYQVDLDDYKTELVTGLSEAWELARTYIKKAQARQKRTYDRRSKPPTVAVGDRAFVYMPKEATGPTHKFARPFSGPFRVIELTPTGAKVRPVDRPQDEPIFVHLDRVRHCPEEVPDTFWPTRKSRKTKRTAAPSRIPQDDALALPKTPLPSAGLGQEDQWTRQRLRPRL